MLTHKVCEALYNSQYHYRNEKDLQQGVFLVLTGLGLTFTPEYRITPRDRIDFITDTGIGIECKSDDSSGGTTLASVTRQLMQYALSPMVTELILITTMSKHRDLPEIMNDKPLFIVHLLRSFL